MITFPENVEEKTDIIFVSLILTCLMDKLTLISGTLFLVADMFALTSLVLPDWIVTEVGGDTRLGLMMSCVTPPRRPPLCRQPRLPGPWLLALAAVMLGILAVSSTIVLILLSVWRRSNAVYAKWTGFIGVIFFCLAAVIFPIGFSQNEIGGAPYQLPNSYQVRDHTTGCPQKKDFFVTPCIMNLISATFYL